MNTALGGCIAALPTSILRLPAIMDGRDKPGHDELNF
jgi:hypothetical protein